MCKESELDALENDLVFRGCAVAGLPHVPQGRVGLLHPICMEANEQKKMG